MKYVGDTIVHPELDSDGKGYHLPIPTYHRAAVGIFPGTKLFLLPVRGTRDLIVTPIDPKKWGDLWRLEVSLKDIPGAAHSVIETLVTNNVNVLIQEGLSESIEGGAGTHRVFLVLDLAGYQSELDKDTKYRSSRENPGLMPNQLITTILSNSFGYLLPTQAGNRWDFSFQRMEFFYRNFRQQESPLESHLLEDKTFVVPKQTVETVFLPTGDDRPNRHVTLTAIRRRSSSGFAFSIRQRGTY